MRPATWLEADYPFTLRFSHDSLRWMHAQDKGILHIMSCPEAALQIGMGNLPGQSGGSHHIGELLNPDFEEPVVGRDQRGRVIEIDRFAAECRGLRRKFAEFRST